MSEDKPTGQMVQEAHAAMAEALHRAAEVVSPQESANLTEEPAPGIAERTKNLIQEAVESTKQALHVGKEAGQETIEGEKPGVTERIKQAVQGAKDNAQETVEGVQPGVAEHLKSGLATMRDRTKEAGPEIIDRIKQVIPPAEKGKQVWEEGKVKVKQGLDSAKSMAPSPGEAYETMSESVSGAVKSGKEAISKISTSTSQRGDVAGGCNVPGGLGLSPVPGAASYAGVGSPTGATELSGATPVTSRPVIENEDQPTGMTGKLKEAVFAGTSRLWGDRRPEMIDETLESAKQKTSETMAQGEAALHEPSLMEKAKDKVSEAIGKVEGRL